MSIDGNRIKSNLESGENYFEEHKLNQKSMKLTSNALRIIRENYEIREDNRNIIRLNSRGSRIFFLVGFFSRGKLRRT